MPFSPKGEIAQWRTVYRLLQAADVGGTITYEEIGAALDIDPAEQRRKLQAAARRAAKQFLHVDDRAVESVPGVGYRIASAERHIPIAGRQVERATKAMEKGRDLTVHVRLDELSDEGRTIVQTMAVGFAAVAEYARQINRRMEDHDGRLGRVEAELARMREDKA